MGRVLQIRVMAQTISASEVGWSWRRLCLIAFDAIPTNENKNQGVLELVDALVDKFRFGNLDIELKNKIEPDLEKVAILREELADALADWNPGEANKLSNALEDALDSLENLAPDQKKK